MPFDLDKYKDKKDVTDTGKGFDLDKYKDIKDTGLKIETYQEMMGGLSKATEPIRAPIRKFLGETIPEKLARNKNPLIKSYGEAMKKGGLLGLLAPLQWGMSAGLGALKETTKRVGLKAKEQAVEQYEKTGELPPVLYTVPGKTYEEQQKEKLEQLIESPLLKEKPVSFGKSIKEAVGKSYWMGDYFKELGTPEGTSAILGLAGELTLDPLNYINISQIPRSLAKIKDGVLKSTKFYDWTKELLLNKLKLDLIIRQGDKLEDIKTAYRANWMRENSTEWINAIHRLGDVNKANKYFNLDELSELYAIQKLDPELATAITDINAVDKTKMGLMAGKKVLVSQEKLTKIANKIGIPYLTDKIRKSLFGTAFIKYGDLDVEASEYLTQLPRVKMATMNELEKVVQPELAKIAIKDKESATLLYYGEDILKDYLVRFKKMDEVAATSETTRMAKQYPEVLNSVQKYYKQLAKIDKEYGIEYPEISRYMASFIDQAYEGRHNIPALSLNKVKEWYQNPKIYANPLEALTAGENPILNINDTAKIRTQATVNAVYRRIGLDTFDSLYGSNEAQKGYKLVKSKYLGNKYFPERIADALTHEEEYINLGKVTNKIRESLNWVSHKWKGFVTYRMPTFHMTNLKGGTEIDLIDYGLGAIKPKNMQVGWDMWRGTNLEKVVETDTGLKYSQRVLKWFSDSLGCGSGFTRSLLSDKPMAKWDIWGIAGAKAGENVEGFMRNRSWWLAFKGTDDPIFAAMKTFLNHFDYGALTPFEKTFINTGFAFWTFRKNIWARTATLMTTKPGKYGQLLDIIRGVEEAAGGREYEKEPSWFAGAPHLKIPVKYKGNYIYVDIQELPIHALTLPSAAIGALETKTQPDKNLWVELFKPITESIYPWWKTGLQNAFNRDMFLNKEIVPSWAKKDPSYRVPAESGWIAYLPKLFKKEMGVEYKYIDGKKRLMIKPQYNELLKTLPIHYQVRALFSSVMYADYDEKQKLLDIFHYLTGIAHPRAIDEKYYQQRYQKEKEKRQKGEVDRYMYELKEEGKRR